jgi:hypothetical protein
MNDKGIGRIFFDLGRATAQFAIYSLGKNERDRYHTEAKAVFITISECSRDQPQEPERPVTPSRFGGRSYLRAYSSLASPSQAN